MAYFVVILQLKLGHISVLGKKIEEIDVYSWDPPPHPQINWLVNVSPCVTAV